MKRYKTRRFFFDTTRLVMPEQIRTNKKMKTTTQIYFYVILNVFIKILLTVKQPSLNPVKEFHSQTERMLEISKELCPASDQPLIPKIFHQIWFDFGRRKAQTEFHKNQTKRLLDLHPGWRYILWHEDEVIQLIKEHVPFFLETFLSYKRPIKRHNSARFVVLYAMGGVYLDHDYIPVRSMDPALGLCKVILTTEENFDRLDPTNALMGGVAKHPFFSFALQKMTTSEYLNVNKGATGVQQLIMAINAFMLEKEKPDGLKLYHPKFFNPVSWKEGTNRIKNYTVSEIRKRFPDSFFYQFYEGSWRY